jgi:hypothetical protein
VFESVSTGFWLLKIPPPSKSAELPLTVQLVSVSVPAKWCSRPPPRLAWLPLMVQSISVVVPPPVARPPPSKAVLPLMVHLVSVAVPPAI